MRVARDEWRVGDQRYYVSDIRSFGTAAGWRARINVSAGLSALINWFEEARRAEAPAIQPFTPVKTMTASEVQIR